MQRSILEGLKVTIRLFLVNVVDIVWKDSAIFAKNAVGSKLIPM